jgi:hypothetical protein
MCWGCVIFKKSDVRRLGRDMGGFPAFSWGFWKKRFLDVVFWWCVCGGMRGKRGQETYSFQGTKSTPRGPELFWVGCFREGLGGV